MADWVHCNSCFHQPGDGRKFFLTNCGHMYCESCVKEGTSNKCKMCGSPCSAIALSSQMKPDVEIFFTDPADIVKKQQRQLLQVMDFQKNHRQRLTAYMKEKNKKQNAVMDDARRKLDQWEDLEREILILKEENSNLRRLLGRSPGTKLSHRTKSPGTGLSPSQKLTGRTPSPSQHSHKSPFAASRGNHPSTPQNNTGDTQTSHAALGQYTPQGPSRITMRTPPVDGKMGTPPTPVRNLQLQTSSSYGSRQKAPTSGSYEVCTPNRSMMPIRSSPMSISPATRISTVSDISHGKDGQYMRTTPKEQHNSQISSQAYHTPPSQVVYNTWDPSKRQIHLSYQPRMPILSAALSDPSKQGKNK